MAARFIGPFRVIDAVGTQAYRLALPSGYKIHNVFHVSLLEPWQQRAGEEPAQPMPLADEEDEWEVEGIRDAKKKEGKQWYLVQWKGWPPEYDSWVPAEDCAHAGSMVRAYEEQTKSKRSRKKTGK